MKKTSKIFIAGHRCIIGSAIHRKLKKEGLTNFILRTTSELVGNIESKAGIKNVYAK
tara:strand:+ start:7742 stop:7912 length:171 start_codon:yes stop_codon:yes gene_type:complete